MNSGISDSDSGQNTKMAGLSQNQCPVYRGMTVRVMPESVSGLLRNMQYTLDGASDDVFVGAMERFNTQGRHPRVTLDHALLSL